MTHLTGAEHYREAERLLDQAKTRIVSEADWGQNAGFVRRTNGLLLAAQVHATLSVAAAPCPDDAA